MDGVVGRRWVRERERDARWVLLMLVCLSQCGHCGVIVGGGESSRGNGVWTTWVWLVGSWGVALGR